MSRFFRLRSLRHRAILVVFAVVVTPLVYVWLTDLWDATLGARMRHRVEQAVESGSDALASPEPERVLDHLASTQRLRIRVLDGAGESTLDLDHERGPNFFGQLEAIFLGSDGAPTLREWDEQQPPLIERQVIRSAMQTGRAAGCPSTDDRKLLVCHAALRIDGNPDIGMIYAQESSRRPIRALYDVRYQMLKLTLIVLILGVGLAWWLGWRMVRPLEMLSEQVLARNHTGKHTAIRLDRDDEFGDLAKVFNEFVTKLNSRNQANETFAADLVHELKNPISAIGVVAEALENPTRLDSARAARLARVLRDSSRRLDHLASGFLDLARAEAGLRSQVRERFDLVELGRALIESLQSDERYRSIEFTLTGSASAQVDAVPERIETVVRNLLSNAATFAAKAHPEGGGRVELIVSTGELLELQVRDNGNGIDRADLDRVFDRFFSRREGGGTGLGLALSQAIIQAHGGQLGVASEKGRGASFTLTLPPPATDSPAAR